MRMFTVLIITLLIIISFSISAKEITYGFMRYDQDENYTVIHPGLTLNTINGFKVPIKLGAYDYVIKGGSLKDIVNFLQKNGEYDAIAQTLEDNGHWVDNSKRTVEVMIVNKGQTASETIVDLVRSRFASIVATCLVDLTAYIPDLLSTIFELGGSADFNSIVTMLRDFNIISETVDIDSASSINVAADSVINLRQSEAFFEYIKANFNLKENFDQVGSINKNKPVIVYLTAYPAPKTKSRIVLNTGKATIKLSEMARMLKEI